MNLPQQKNNNNAYRQGDRDSRPWGEWEVLVAHPDYVVKHITVLPGQRLSLQRHNHRAEVWVVIRGQAEVTVEGQVLHLVAGQTAIVPQGAWHRIRNSGAGVLEFVETQTGSILDEADIERSEDDFGRA